MPEGSLQESSAVHCSQYPTKIKDNNTQNLTVIKCHMSAPTPTIVYRHQAPFPKVIQLGVMYIMYRDVYYPCKHQS